MGSIYKKGRDGYFYYQTYIRNSETGKKDKRIFHALGTKNKNEAEVLKKKFDEKYNGITVKTKIKQRYFLLFGIIILCLIWFFLSSTMTKSKNIKRQTNILNPIDTLKRLPDNVASDLTVSNNIKDTIKLNVSKSIERFEFEKRPALNKKSNIQINLPNYEVQRIESLSNIFDQGKIYITVKKSSDRKAIKLLCSKLREKYPQYSNIIICVYTDNKIGMALANGFQSEISNDLKKENWLALYSYHKVEGEYFDENPGGYLSGY